MRSVLRSAIPPNVSPLSAQFGGFVRLLGAGMLDFFLLCVVGTPLACVFECVRVCRCTSFLQGTHACQHIVCFRWHAHTHTILFLSALVHRFFSLSSFLSICWDDACVVCFSDIMLCVVFQNGHSRRPAFCPLSDGQCPRFFSAFPTFLLDGAPFPCPLASFSSFRMITHKKLRIAFSSFCHL